MKSLLERLKPEIKEIFDAEAITYPTTVNIIMSNFDQNKWVGDIRLSIISDIASVEGLKEYLGVDYNEMFLFTTLDKMFNEK